jgi:hypothetical protein
MIYVATLHSYDYYEFSDLMTASNDVGKVVDFCTKRKDIKIYFVKDLTEEKKSWLKKHEIEHYRITEFED